jgi:protein arginine kinase
MLAAPKSAWLEDGPDADVVVSSRARVARNFAGFPFVNRAHDSVRVELLELARKTLTAARIADRVIWVDLRQASETERQLLVERHLISRPHAAGDQPRGVAVSDDEALSIMVNEEDHLRIQVLAPGASLDRVFDRLQAADDAVEAHTTYAFSPRWGYATACPTNVGTGIRFSVMMHLAALKMSGEIERVRRAAKELHLAVRGYYGEGSDSAGDFYQISNQLTLGRSERELLEDFQRGVVPQLIEYERQARTILADRKPVLLDDRVFRALGALRSARLLGTEEAMKLLSRVRLGIHMNRLPGISESVVNRLFLGVQPAHLQQSVGRGLQPDELRAARADLVRASLA